MQTFALGTYRPTAELGDLQPEIILQNQSPMIFYNLLNFPEQFLTPYFASLQNDLPSRHVSQRTFPHLSHFERILLVVPQLWHGTDDILFSFSHVFNKLNNGLFHCCKIPYNSIFHTFPWLFLPVFNNLKVFA